MHNLLDALVAALGWALLNFVWQGVLISCSVALAMQLLRRARPQTRYAVACGAMLLCLLLPLASVIASLHSGNQNGSSSGRILGSLVSTLYAGTTGNSDDVSSSGIDAGSSASGSSKGSASAVGTSAGGWHALGRLGRALQDDSERVLRQQLPWIVGLWLTGGVLMTLRLVLGLQWVATRTQRSAYTINHYWQRRMALLASRCDMRRDVRLGVAEGIDSPITAGCWRPIILVPVSLISGMPPDLLEALLAHELAHIRRHDYLVNLLQSAIEILLFYHPSVWALSRRIRIEREQIADDLAVDMLGQPHKLAQALAQLDQFQFDSTQLAHAAHGGNLMSRISRLVRPHSEPASRKLALPLLGLFAAGAMLYAHATADTGAGAGAASVPAAGAPVAAALAPASAMDALSVPDAVPAKDASQVKDAVPAKDAVTAADAVPANEAAQARSAKAPRALSAVPSPPALPALPAQAALPPLPAQAALPARPALPAPPAPAAPAAALPVLPVPPAPVAEPGLSRGAAFALVRDDNRTMVTRTSSLDRAEIDAARARVKGDFIWFRDGKKGYVIQDAAMLAQAQAAWATVESIGARMEEQGKKMEQQGQAMDAIGKQMDAVGRDLERQFAAPSAEQQRKIDALARQQEAIARRIEQAARKLGEQPSREQMQQFQQRQAELQRQMQPLQQQIEQLARQQAQQHVQAQEQALQQSMQSLHARMAEANKPMAAMGQKMGELGREQVEASRAAERVVRELIREAKKSGKAQPVSNADPA